MAKLIAFIGSPSSGKTTLALKTAMAAYMDKRTKNSRIVFLSPDINVPSVAVLFPNYVPDEICSLGAILDNTDISADMLLKNIVTVKTMKDFGCLGFKSGESKFSYPTPTDDKISDLFNALSEIADFIFVDCTDRTDDKISKRALTSADIVFRVMSADPKGITWYSSNKNMGRVENEDIFNIVTVLDNEWFQDYNETPTIRKISEKFDLAKSSVQRYLVPMNESGMIEYCNGEIVTDYIRKVSIGGNYTPLVGGIPCGDPNVEDSVVEEYVNLPCSIFGKNRTNETCERSCFFSVWDSI